MKILVVWHAGMVRSYRTRFRVLAASHTITLVAPKDWSVEPEPDRSYEDTFPIIGLATRGHGRTAGHTYRFGDVLRVLREVRPDLLYIIEEPESLSALQWALAGRLLRPRPKIAIETLENIRRRYRFPLQAVQALTLRLADGFATIDAETEDVLEWKGVPRDRIFRFTYWGVDEVAAPPPLRGGNGLRVGYLGRLVPEKGIDCLLRAVADMAGVSVVIGGSGPDEARLRGIAGELGITERVEWTGAVSAAGRAGFFAGIDVLVLPSRATPSWKEQFGRVLIESMAHGRPVIGSSSGAIPRVIGDAGLVFPEDDVAALRRAIARMADPRCREAFSRRALERARTLYRWETVARQMERIFKALLRP